MNITVVQKLSEHKTLCLCQQCKINQYICNLYDAKKSKVGNLCVDCKQQITSMLNPTQEQLKKVFNYCEVTGTVTLKNTSLSGIKDELVGHTHSSGYLSVSIGRKDYLLHRVIWMLQTGFWPDQIDHINHDRKDNRWKNLREVTNLENQLNKGRNKNNSSKATGVRQLPGGNFWAYIMVNRKQIGLGSHKTFEEACEARKAANKLYGFHDNHGIWG